MLGTVSSGMPDHHEECISRYIVHTGHGSRTSTYCELSSLGDRLFIQLTLIKFCKAVTTSVVGGNHILQHEPASGGEYDTVRIPKSDSGSLGKVSNGHAIPLQ